MSQGTIILGIDPGVGRTGYGVIVNSGMRREHIAHGCIFTPAGMSLEKRLFQIYEALLSLIDTHTPHKLAVEQLFFCNNVKTALSVGHARGVILLCGAKKNIPLFEYTPLQVKSAITSYGKADKRQVQNMVKLILGLSEIPKPDDAADALAIALCCSQNSQPPARV